MEPEDHGRLAFNYASDGFTNDFSREMQWLAFRDGVYGAELLAVAVTEFDFFSHLSRSPSSGSGICDLLGLPRRPVDVMLTLFSAMGLVEKAEEKFRVAERAGELLDRQSLWFEGPYDCRPVYHSILEVLRTNRPSGWARNLEPWAQQMESVTFARGFTRTMDRRGLYLGPALAAQIDLTEYRRLLDIAGGSGIYSCCIVASHPHLYATVLEKAPVDGVASKCIADRGCLEQVDVLAGDMFSESLPHGYDVHLWSNVLHDWDTPEVEELLQKSFDALPAGGMIVIHDLHIYRDKTGPLPIALHSVFLMVATEGKCHSVGDLEDLLIKVGFVSMTYRPTVVDYSILTAHKPGSVN